ncbi:unnamed protein product [Bursaphelenchus okinawaensis]|uniref:Uncharacterized protein n=1 Tax=Bursaphelenchus okinawaensis TaxID=465554 RepID=A0A811K547_9BILA|nr:unnamed protein product [Bursaphelenchus okinawaensis]CAG9091554.1 unnamed protein product [Bursaphelenchus okinawaensis]
MEVYLFEREKYHLLYNCTFYDWNTVPLERRRHRFLGASVIAFYVATMVLYIPCLMAMMHSENRKRASYQLMFLLGVMHLFGIQTCGLFTGIHAYFGHVYCDYPNLMYFFGSLGVSMWASSTLTSFYLGINRCAELTSGWWADVLFGGYCKVFWISTPIMYFFYFFFFTPSAFFNGEMMSWFFNPHYGYFEDTTHKYQSTLHSMNNLGVVIAHSGVYAYFFFVYFKRTRMTKSLGNIRDKSTYIQILIIGAIHFIAAVSYVIIQYLPPNFYYTLVASSAYLASHGTPPVIYIWCNKTIRRYILRKFWYRVRPRGVITISEQSRVKTTGKSSEALSNLH